MILLFGGTTEGLAAAHLLDVLGESYLYLTQTPTSQRVNGEHRHGALDAEDMVALCRQVRARLVIDAGHPFASQLHGNIFTASEQTGVPVVRFERPGLMTDMPGVRFFDSFAQMCDALALHSVEPVLALTGVQTIVHFKAVWAMPVHFRILDTDLSMQKALLSGIPPGQVHAAPAHITAQSVQQLIDRTGARLLLTKESGQSGYYSVKQEVARRNNIPLWVVRRPPMPAFAHTVFDVKALHRLMLTMRKELWKEDANLRSGYTTGTCVTACAKAALAAIATGRFPTDVTVVLPEGERVRLAIYPQHLDGASASCLTIKDAGDDPDVTHAAEIGCRVDLAASGHITFERGVGVGVVTLPGLQCPVGEPAINVVPRRMICEALTQTAHELEVPLGMRVTPFVPDGEALAQRTFNPRVGVAGGISIIGTSGRVVPLSHEAFVGAIRQQIEVARAMGCRDMVATSGRRSELLVQPRFAHLPHQAFVHHGNFIGDTVQMVADAGFGHLVLGIMVGKAIKLAEGYLNTHSHRVTFNADFAAQMALDTGYDRSVADAIRQLTLANAICGLIPFGGHEPFYMAMACRCHQAIKATLQCNMALTVMILNDDREVTFSDFSACC